jgi:hypothetical protein
MAPEAPLEGTEAGLVPNGEGWFVLNARDAAWHQGHFGAYTRFEGQPRFPQVGINIGVLAPGQPAASTTARMSRRIFSFSPVSACC